MFFFFIKPCNRVFQQAVTIKDTLGLKVAYWLGILAALVGIIAAFWHISLFAGILILASIIGGAIPYVHYAIRLHRLDRELNAREHIENLTREGSGL